MAGGGAPADARAPLQGRRDAGRNGGGCTGRRGRLYHARALVDTPYLRDQRAAERLHGRGREDRIAREGDGESELSPGAGSDSAADRACTRRARAACRSQGRDGNGEGAAWWTRLARRSRGTALRR